MSEPKRRPRKLGFIVVPLMLVPVGLALLRGEEALFAIRAAAICIAAPAGGFWWGEMRGQSEPGRAALGCVGTVALFVAYVLWAFVIAPWLFAR
ncbi:MAG: hypothetical protein QOE70_1035 [Chthoniobacter sp.]|nr:hypothetical protein [Chthoniobacter sp.]